MIFLLRAYVSDVVTTPDRLPNPVRGLLFPKGLQDFEFPAPEGIIIFQILPGNLEIHLTWSVSWSIDDLIRVQAAQAVPDECGVPRENEFSELTNCDRISRTTP